MGGGTARARPEVLGQCLGAARDRSRETRRGESGREAWSGGLLTGLASCRLACWGSFASSSLALAPALALLLLLLLLLILPPLLLLQNTRRRRLDEQGRGIFLPPSRGTTGPAFSFFLPLSLSLALLTPALPRLYSLCLQLGETFKQHGPYPTATLSRHADWFPSHPVFAYFCTQLCGGLVRKGK